MCLLSLLLMCLHQCDMIDGVMRSRPKTCCSNRQGRVSVSAGASTTAASSGRDEPEVAREAAAG